MAYVKNIWVDQEVERPRTYQKIDNADGSFTLVDDFGLVSELGTPVNADNMNHIEEGIEAGSFTKYDENATYSTNDLVTLFLDEDLVIYKSLKDNNKGNPLTDANYWEEIKLGGGAGQPIGTIYPLTCTKDYVPEGSLPCDGTEYTKAQFTDLWNNYITTALLNTCTYDEYATELATYGQCGKFAVDTTNNKFKVPTIKDGAVIQQALSNSELGKAYNAGLPNLYGQFGTGQNEYFDGVLFTQSDNIKDDTAEGGSSDTSAIFDASKYNPIYGNSDTVQMNAVALRYFVVVANGSINQNQMDWSQWASNLQGKINADHSNDLYPYIKEMYQNGTSWYVLYSNGWCMQGFRVAAQTQSKQVAYTLLKTMRDTNYSAMFTENAGTGGCYQTKVFPTSTTQITVVSPSGGGMGGGFVEVCGYTL